MSNKKNPTMYLMFLHRHAGRGGKALNLFHRVQSDGTALRDDDGEPEAHVYSRDAKAMKGSALRNPVCGGIYEVEYSEEDSGSIYPGTATLTGRLSDGERVTEWQALDQATRDDIEATKAEKREARRDYVFERLDPVKRAYRKMSGAQRAVFLARVVKYITGATP